MPILALMFIMLMVTCKDKENNPTTTGDIVPRVESSIPENNDNNVIRNQKVIIPLS